MKGSFLFCLTLISAVLGRVLSDNLNVTAISTSKGKSRFECWELTEPFTSSTQPGVVGTKTLNLGDVANITYNTIPADFDCGLHAAPYKQWFMVLQGTAVITAPGSNFSEIVVPGSLAFVEDTADVSQEGHDCYVATDAVILQIPTKDGEAPGHLVISDDAPCTGSKRTNSKISVL